MTPLNYTLEIANLHYINITTVTFKALKNYKLVKKQENMTHSQIKKSINRNRSSNDRDDEIRR